MGAVDEKRGGVTACRSGIARLAEKKMDRCECSIPSKGASIIVGTKLNVGGGKGSSEATQLGRALRNGM